MDAGAAEVCSKSVQVRTKSVPELAHLSVNRGVIPSARKVIPKRKKSSKLDFWFSGFEWRNEVCLCCPHTIPRGKSCLPHAAIDSAVWSFYNGITVIQRFRWRWLHLDAGDQQVPDAARDEHGDKLRAEHKAAERVLHAQRIETAQLIAEQLGETNEEPKAQIYRIVKKLGIERALDFLRRTHEIEATGGVMVPNGSRRRTPGGVFFSLVKEETPVKVAQHIFKKRYLYRQAAQRGNAASARAAPQSPVPITWADRLPVLKELAAEKGQATVKITLFGRPGRIVERGTCVMTSMESSKIPALPRGLPTPPPSSTTYTVYIALKQWHKVAEAIGDEDDALIIEGYPYLDAEAGTIVVLVANTTTRKLQAAQRQAQQQK
jgi:hypothetical protein